MRGRASSTLAPPLLLLSFLLSHLLFFPGQHHFACHASDVTPPPPDVSSPGQDSVDLQGAAEGDVSTCSADGASTCGVSLDRGSSSNGKDDSEGSANLPPRSAPLHVPLLWMGPFLSGGGYASEALSYASALVASRQVENFSIRQHGDGYNWDYISGLPDATQVMLQGLLEGSESPEVGRQGVVVCHSEPGAWNPPLFDTSLCPPYGYGDAGRVRGGRYTVGRTMFETDRLLPEHVERCNRMDEVWVPTDFHIRTFEASGVQASKLRKVPQAVDTAEFFPAEQLLPAQVQPEGGEDSGKGSSWEGMQEHSWEGKRLQTLPEADLVFGNDILGLATGKGKGKGRRRGRWGGKGWGGQGEGGEVDTEGTPFVFLSVFKWEARKGWDVLVKAYLGEFSGADRVALYMLTNPYHSDTNFEAKIKEFVKNSGLGEPEGGWPSVYVRRTHVGQRELPAVYRAADAFVLPSRGEGWGRPHVEAMASGLPVVATNWSGMTEYLTEFSGFPLAVEKLVEVPEGVFRGHLWAEPSLAHLRERMRHLVAHPGEARAVGRRARALMQAQYSPAAVGAIVLRRLQEIEQRLKERGDGTQQ